MVNYFARKSGWMRPAVSTVFNVRMEGSRSLEPLGPLCNKQQGSNYFRSTLSNPSLISLNLFS
jgi:hypothetical protein